MVYIAPVICYPAPVAPVILWGLEDSEMENVRFENVHVATFPKAVPRCQNVSGVFTNTTPSFKACFHEKL